MIIHLRSKNQAHLRLTLLPFLLPEKTRACFCQFLAQCHSLIIFSKVHNFSFSKIIRKPVIEKTISLNRKSIITVLHFSLPPKQISLKQSKHKTMLVTELEKAKTEFKIYAKRQQYDKSVNSGDDIITDTENGIHSLHLYFQY